MLLRLSVTQPDRPIIAISATTGARRRESDVGWLTMATLERTAGTGCRSDIVKIH